MSWRAIVPLKGAGGRKTRLAGLLDAGARNRLALAMFHHVTATLAVAGVAVTALSPERPTGWPGAWQRDEADDLNAALEQASGRLGQRRLAIVHADLPMLTEGDVRALLAAAGDAGLALAADRHGTGTNAIAIADGAPLRFRFGAGSLAAMVATAGRPCRIVHREGLACDLDTPADRDHAIMQGCAVIR